MSAKWMHGCGWAGWSCELLRAPSPFDSSDELFACPECRRTEDIEALCEVDGCRQLATCVGPHPDGVYRHTCYGHYLRRLAP
jgi:hypothetical protein